MNVKKIMIAIVTAICCFVVTAPVQAKAKDEEFKPIILCRHDNPIKTYVDGALISEGTHIYSYTADENKNGVPETVYAECYYVVLESVYELTCSCGNMEKQKIVETTEIHFDCD